MITITPEYLESQGLSPTIVERFWDKVLILPYDKGCWLWIAATDHNGYGVIGRGGRYGLMISAHRVSWIIFRGTLMPGEPLRHSCDEPLCVRPDHLSPGTQLQNVHDMIARGRMPRGSARGGSVLTEQEVVELRSAHANARLSYRQLAQRFGIKPGTVGDIIRREKWTHV